MNDPSEIVRTAGRRVDDPSLRHTDGSFHGQSAEHRAPCRPPLRAARNETRFPRAASSPDARGWRDPGTLPCRARRAMPPAPPSDRRRPAPSRPSGRASASSRAMRRDDALSRAHGRRHDRGIVDPTASTSIAAPPPMCAAARCARSSSLIAFLPAAPTARSRSATRQGYRRRARAPRSSSDHAPRPASTARAGQNGRRILPLSPARRVQRTGDGPRQAE